MDANSDPPITHSMKTLASRCIPEACEKADVSKVHTRPWTTFLKLAVK